MKVCSQVEELANAFGDWVPVDGLMSPSGSSDKHIGAALLY